MKKRRKRKNERSLSKKPINGKRHKMERACTLPIRKIKRDDLDYDRLLYPETIYNRPKTRGDCKNGLRPCPYVGCKYHLYLDVNPSSGSIKINFPGLEVWEMEETCALDLAGRFGMTLEEVGEAINLTRERIRQIEMIMIEKIESFDSDHDNFLEWCYFEMTRKEDDEYQVDL